MAFEITPVRGARDLLAAFPGIVTRQKNQTYEGFPTTQNLCGLVLDPHHHAGFQGCCALHDHNEQLLDALLFQCNQLL